MRSSQTPAPTGLQSPKLPLLNRVRPLTLGMIRRLVTQLHDMLIHATAVDHVMGPTWEQLYAPQRADLAVPRPDLELAHVVRQHLHGLAQGLGHHVAGGDRHHVAAVVQDALPAGRPQRHPLNEFYRTPNMERLAARGVRFTQAFVLEHPREAVWELMRDPEKVAACMPGLSGLLVAHAARAFDQVDEAHLAVHGTGGPWCARNHHDALSGTSVGWHDGEWLQRPAGSGRELCWFPDPVGPRDCYRFGTAEPMLLQRVAPPRRA